MGEVGIKIAFAWVQGGRVQDQSEKDTAMGLSAILIAAALSITMFIAVTDAS